MTKISLSYEQIHMQRDLINTKIKLNKTKIKIIELENKIHNIKLNLTKSSLKENYDFIFGTNECSDSPTGQCVYDLNTDHNNIGEDKCLFCGHIN